MTRPSSAPSSPASEQVELAVVDVSGLAPGSPGALERVAALVEAPAREQGAFHVVGHGMKPEALSRFEAAMRALFDLPLEAKRAIRRTRENAWGWFDEELTKNRPDWKEIFDFGPERRAGAPAPRHSDGVNQWPAGRDDIARELLAHFERCEALALPLLRALCAALGVAPGSLDAATRDHSSFLRLNRYAPCPDPAAADAPPLPETGRLGVHPHSDAGLLTVLYQDAAGGLQLELPETGSRPGGRFALVKPVPGALTINLGDMLQVWSNDRFRSPVHRVLASREHTRHSAPFFLNPGYDAVGAPLPALVGEGAPARFRPVPWAHFRDQRSAGDYADQGTEIQVADYRIGG